MGDTGLENLQIPKENALLAKEVTPKAPLVEADATVIAKNWHLLPMHIRRAIADLVENACRMERN